MHVAFVVQESQGFQNISGAVLDHPHGAALVAGVQQQLGHADVQQLQQQAAGRAIGRVVVGEHAIQCHYNETQGQASVTSTQPASSTAPEHKSCRKQLRCFVAGDVQRDREPERKKQGKTSHATPAGSGGQAGLITPLRLC